MTARTYGLTGKRWATLKNMSKISIASTLTLQAPKPLSLVLVLGNPLLNLERLHLWWFLHKLLPLLGDLVGSPPEPALEEGATVMTSSSHPRLRHQSRRHLSSISAGASHGDCVVFHRLGASIRTHLGPCDVSDFVMPCHVILCSILALGPLHSICTRRMRRSVPHSASCLFPRP